MEKLIEYDTEIDIQLLVKYALHYSQTTTKTLGLLLDIAHIDSKGLEKYINRKSTSRMLNTSDMFSNRWRLYYDSILLEKQEI